MVVASPEGIQMLGAMNQAAPGWEAEVTGREVVVVVDRLVAVVAMDPVAARVPAGIMGQRAAEVTPVQNPQVSKTQAEALATAPVAASIFHPGHTPTVRRRSFRSLMKS